MNQAVGCIIFGTVLEFLGVPTTPSLSMSVVTRVLRLRCI